MGICIAVAIEKGGVGKTATATNLAALMAMDGKKTLVIDTDSQCNTTYFLTGHKKRENFFRDKGLAELLRAYSLGVDVHQFVQPTNIKNLDIIPSNASTTTIPDILGLLDDTYHKGMNTYLAYSIAPIMDEYDFIVIDTPPNLDVLTTSAMTASDYIIIPFNCEEQALDGLQDTDEVRGRLEKQENATIKVLGILLTMVERTLLTHNMREELRESRYGKYLFHTEIRKAQAVKDSATIGSPVVVCGKSSNPAKDYTALYNEIKKRLKEWGEM